MKIEIKPDGSAVIETGSVFLPVCKIIETDDGAHLSMTAGEIIEALKTCPVFASREGGLYNFLNRATGEDRIAFVTDIYMGGAFFADNADSVPVYENIYR